MTLGELPKAPISYSVKWGYGFCHTGPLFG